ncbi:hypothetical protein EGK14_05660 [Erwinia sp. 198]|nr:hypothetical protein EGK14_05660 [Erwinia sp. 198]
MALSDTKLCSLHGKPYSGSPEGVDGDGWVGAGNDYGGNKVKERVRERSGKSSDWITEKGCF